MYNTEIPTYCFTYMNTPPPFPESSQKILDMFLILPFRIRIWTMSCVFLKLYSPRLIILLSNKITLLHVFQQGRIFDTDFFQTLHESR